jgi:integrase
MGSKKKTTTKRRRRFGTILPRVRSDGRVVYRARWSEGRAGKRPERIFNSEKEARAFLKGIQKQMLLGLYRTPPTASDLERGDTAQHHRPLTLIEYAQRVFESRLEANLAESSRAVYRASLGALEVFFGRRVVNGRVVPAKRLDKVSKASFLDYRAFRRGLRRTRSEDAEVMSRPVSPATVNRDQQFLSVVLAQAVIDGLIERNPLSGVKPLKEPRRPRRWLAKTEVQALIGACDDLFRPFVLAMLFTGCRPIELRGLTWADVKFESGKLSIFRSKVGNYDELDLHPRLEEELRALKARQGTASTPENHVFLNRYGNPWRDMRRAWTRTVKAAGLDGRKGVTLYSLRHTFATHFLDDGGAATDLKAQLGHSDLSTTQRYADLVSKRRRETVRRLDYGEELPDADGVAEFAPPWKLTLVR